MHQPEKAIFTVLCLVYDDNGHILVENRLSKTWSGVALPGGHVEPNESFTQAAIREVYEETGLSVHNLRLCGVKQFQQDQETRYVVFLYKTNCYSGTLRSSEEGNVFWIRRDEIDNYPVVDDFEELLRVFEQDDFNEFIYTHDGSNWQVHII